MTQGFQPINGRPRDLVPSAPIPAPVSAPQPQASQKATQKVLCICTACSGNGSGKLVAPKTKKEHEHADRIERDGVRVDDEAKCQRCRAASLDCFKGHENSIVCGNCVRHKERCSWNGQSKRKRDAARRQNQAALAAQRGQQEAETPVANGDGGAAVQEQPAPCDTNGMLAVDQLLLGGNRQTGGEQSTPNSGEENREGTSSRSPSGSHTADETECPQPPHKRQRKNPPAAGSTA
ncbi:hypothetical protein CH35J_000679 [Colletotrichum higginsianum]|nr:hypothetical protein CH35J_000679 [Colletotrichum higginsianum]